MAGVESERFKIDSGVIQGSINSPWLFNVYMDEGGEDGDGKEGREWRLPGLLYADDLVICGESEEDLWSGMKINAGKSKVMVLNGED